MYQLELTITQIKLILFQEEDKVSLEMTIACM